MCFWFFFLVFLCDMSHVEGAGAWVTVRAGSIHEKGLPNKRSARKGGADGIHKDQLSLIAANCAAHRR